MTHFHLLIREISSNDYRLGAFCTTLKAANEEAQVEIECNSKRTVEIRSCDYNCWSKNDLRRK